MAEFKESEHPRDKDGKFTDKGAARKSVIQRLRERHTARLGKRTKTLEQKDGFQSGAVSGADNGGFLEDIEKEEAEALKRYEIIRNDNSDIELISKNTGISIEIVKRAKNHLFYEKHNLDKGYVTFDPNQDIADSWERLKSGNEIKEQDKILVLHEYLESIYMSQGLTYSEAHSKSNQKYNYEKYYK